MSSRRGIHTVKMTILSSNGRLLLILILESSLAQVPSMVGAVNEVFSSGTPPVKMDQPATLNRSVKITKQISGV